MTAYMVREKASGHLVGIGLRKDKPPKVWFRPRDAKLAISQQAYGSEARKRLHERYEVVQIKITVPQSGVNP